MPVFDTIGTGLPEYMREPTVKKLLPLTQAPCDQGAAALRLCGLGLGVRELAKTDSSEKR